MNDGTEDLKQWRQSRGITQARAAHWVGVQAATWGRWERGTTRLPVMLRRMLRAIEIIERETQHPRLLTVTVGGSYYLQGGYRPWEWELTEWSIPGAEEKKEPAHAH